MRSSPALHGTSRSHRGSSLIELMVSIAIGLLVVVVVLQMYLGASRTARTQDAASRLDTNGRFAIESVARMARMAGYRNWGGPVSPPGYNGTGEVPVDGADGASATTNYSDTLTLRFTGSGPAPGTADGTVVDCLGNPLPAMQLWTERSANTFSVRSVGGTLELTCDNGTGPVTLISGIDSFQVLYGIDTVPAAPARDGAADLWVRASDVAGRWDRVVALKVSLLVAGDANSRGADLDTNTYRLFDVNYINAADQGTVFNAGTQSTGFRNRLHKVYTTTIFLRNRTMTSDV